MVAERRDQFVDRRVMVSACGNPHVILINSASKLASSKPMPALYSHPAALPDDELLKQCELGFGRGSGPGGQHRNKVETACLITHEPTGISASAKERRSQSQNRHQAIKRLRLSLAVGVRTQVHHARHQPSDLWRSRRQGEKVSINPEHSDYPALLAEALDVIVARRFDVAGAAGVFGVTMSQLAKLVRHEPRAFKLVNDGRVAQGLRALK